MIDTRAHGASGGPIATYGWLERSDTRAIVDALLSSEHVGAGLAPPASSFTSFASSTSLTSSFHLFALGESMAPASPCNPRPLIPASKLSSPKPLSPISAKGLTITPVCEIPLARQDSLRSRRLDAGTSCRKTRRSSGRGSLTGKSRRLSPFSRRSRYLDDGMWHALPSSQDYAAGKGREATAFTGETSAAEDRRVFRTMYQRPGAGSEESLASQGNFRRPAYRKPLRGDRRKRLRDDSFDAGISGRGLQGDAGRPWIRQGRKGEMRRLRK